MEKNIDIKTNNVDYKKFNTIIDKRDHSFLQSSFVSLLIGKPGSGKT